MTRWHFPVGALPTRHPAIILASKGKHPHFYGADLQISRKSHCNSLAIADDFIMATQVLSDLAAFKQQNAIEVLQIERIMQAHDNGLATELGSYAD